MKSTQQYAEEINKKWGLTLTSEYIGAHNLVTFKCINNHNNQATATNLLQRGYKCKECTTGRSIVSKFDWSDSNTNLILEALKTKETKIVANEFGITEAAINNRLAKLQISNPRERISKQRLLDVLSDQERLLESEYLGSKTLVSIKCKNKHLVKQEASNIISFNTNCPKCFHARASKIETEILNFVKSNYSGWIEIHDRTILEGKELDIVVPDLGIAIEINGTYWHSEEKVGVNYHKNKTEAVEALGYQLIHIKDYDWFNKQDIIKSLLRNKLKITSAKIPARKCTIKKIPFPRDFLNANHIQGAGQPTSENYGLFYNNELVAVATFGKPRYDNNADTELIRYCTILNTNVQGGLSKLLSIITNRTIVSYASRDYSIGDAYTKVGFKLDRVTAPGLEYYSRYNKISRYTAQSLTKEELSKYTKYHNSGNLVFYKN